MAKPEFTKSQEKYIALGVVFGTVIGVLTDNIGLWLALGIAIGVVTIGSQPRCRKVQS